MIESSGREPFKVDRLAAFFEAYPLRVRLAVSPDAGYPEACRRTMARCSV